MRPAPSIQPRNLQIAIAFLILCTLNIIAYAPGFMSPDSIDQYGQALHGVYHDWHQPAFALLWRQLLNVHSSALPVLVLQMLLLWGSVYILLSACSDTRLRILFVVFPFLPFVQNFSGYIIKDSHMALSLLLAVAFMFRAYSSQRKLRVWELMLTILLLTYAGIVRPNALPAVLPLFVLIAALQTASKVKFFIYCIGLLVVTLAANKLQYAITRPTKLHPEVKLYMHDLTGVFVKTGQNVFPPWLYRDKAFDTAYLRAHYTEATFDNIWWNDDGKNVLQDADDAVADSMHQYWRKTIMDHPSVYLANHIKGFSYFLRLNKRTDDFYSLYPYIHPNDYGFKYHRTLLSNLFLKPIEFQRNMPYMRPWFWLFFNLVLLFFVKKVARPYRHMYLALLLSALLYLLPTFFIYQVDTDFRYMYWNCIACSLAFILLVPSMNKKAAVQERLPS